MTVKNREREERISYDSWNVDESKHAVKGGTSKPHSTLGRPKLVPYEVCDRSATQGCQSIHQVLLYSSVASEHHKLHVSSAFYGTTGSEGDFTLAINPENGSLPASSSGFTSSRAGKVLRGPDNPTPFSSSSCWRLFSVTHTTGGEASNRGASSTAILPGM